MTPPPTPSMTYPAHARALLRLGLPLVGGNLAFVAIGLTDTIMLGWYSVEALAAVVLATSFFFVVFLVGTGFAWAITPMVAGHAEAGDHVQVRRVTRMGIWASMVFAFGGVPLLLSAPVTLRLLGQSADLVALASAYLQIAAWGLFPALAGMVLRNYLSALERTQIALWATVGAALLNGVLDYVLIFGKFGAPELGITGAAIASVVMQIAILIILMVYARMVAPEHRLFARLWRIDADALASVFRLGWPIGLTLLAEVGLFSATAIMMGWLGTIPLAAHGIVLQLASLTFVVHLGLSSAATVRAGRAAKRGDAQGLRRGGIVATGLSLAMAAIAISAFVLIPEVLSGFFVDPDDPAREAIIATSVVLLLIAALFQTFDGIQVIALGLLRGILDTRTPMIYAAVSYWLVGAPASYLLGFVAGWGGVGVWSGLVLGLATASVLLTFRFWRSV